MLVETKAITELGLHLGGTWFVIAATIVLVLVMAFLANSWSSASSCRAPASPSSPCSRACCSATSRRATTT